MCASIATCCVERLAPHVNLDYLSHPKRYLRRHFSDSRVSLGFVEQASLLRRIQEAGDLPIAYPATPRAFHAGFYGRNRPGGITGELKERVRRLDAMIYDSHAMRDAALSERYAADSEPVQARHGRAAPACVNSSLPSA